MVRLIYFSHLFPFTAAVQVPRGLDLLPGPECCPPFFPQTGRRPSGKRSTKPHSPQPPRSRGLFVCWARTDVGSKKCLRRLRPASGTLGSREPGRQTQSRETEDRATPAHWSETHPSVSRGGAGSVTRGRRDVLMRQPISAPYRCAPDQS